MDLANIIPISLPHTLGVTLPFSAFELQIQLIRFRGLVGHKVNSVQWRKQFQNSVSVWRTYTEHNL
jgi:hypothetical protein